MRSRKNDYWVWSPYSTVRGMAFVTKIGGLSNVAVRRILGGERLPRRPRLVVTDYTRGRFWDQLGAYIGLHLVSPVLAEEIVAAGANVQLLPVRVIGKPKLEYFVVNVLDTLPALDLERSKVAVFPDTDIIYQIKRFTQRRIPDDAPPIFHVAEAPTRVLVNDALRRRLEAASRHPGDLTPTGKYRDEY